MASFILRKVDDDLWQRFRARATSEGHTMKWVLLALIESYVQSGLPPGGRPNL